MFEMAAFTHYGPPRPADSARDPLLLCVGNRLKRKPRARGCSGDGAAVSVALPERPASALSGRAAGAALLTCPRCRCSKVSRSYFTAQLRAASRRSRITDGVEAAAWHLPARPVDYDGKQRPERHVVGGLRHDRQGVDCWEPAADQADVDDPDREPGCWTPSDRAASGQRSGQHFPAPDGDADMDDGAAREPTPPWRK
jgi:hypothetical protein